MSHLVNGFLGLMLLALIPIIICWLILDGGRNLLEGIAYAIRKFTE